MAAILCAFCKRSKTAYQPDQPTLITNATVVLARIPAFRNTENGSNSTPALIHGSSEEAEILLQGFV